MTTARKDIFEPTECGFYHCVSRCVRRAFLCGYDRLSDKSFEHRKGWACSRLAQLIQVFAIECIAYAIMENHLHTALHNRPDIASHWSDVEVARRWRILFPRRRKHDGTPEEPNLKEIQAITSQPELVTKYRSRLCDISWFNRCLNEYLARKSNAEDECTGRFWEGRFKCQRLERDAAVVACCVYVDLNRVRSGLALTPEDSDFTSIQDRIRESLGNSSKGTPQLMSFQEVLEEGPSTQEYLELVDETGRLLRDGKHSIPEKVLPVLKRLGLKPEGWVQNARAQNQLFRRVIGPLSCLRELAAAKGKAWFQGHKSAQLVFA